MLDYQVETNEQGKWKFKNPLDDSDGHGDMRNLKSCKDKRAKWRAVGE